MKLNNETIANLKPKAMAYEVYDEKVQNLVLRVQPTGYKSYYFVYRNAQGKKKRIKLGTHSRITITQARNLALKAAGRIANGEDVQATKQNELKEAKVKALRTLSRFIDEQYQPRHNPDGKYGNAERVINHFPHLLDCTMEDITPETIDFWRRKKLNEHVKPQSINRIVAALSSILGKAVAWELLERHPLEKLKPLPTKESHVVRYLSTEEEQNLRDALAQKEQEKRDSRQRYLDWFKNRKYEPPHFHHPDSYATTIQPMVLLSLNTGLRRSELYKLQWEYVDLERKQITIIGTTSKNGRTRFIPLNSEALDILKKLKRHSGYNPLVFPGDEGGVRHDPGKVWDVIRESAGLKNFRWHDLRHTFASKLVMRGVDLNTVRELMGHQDIKTTLIYAHLSPEHKADAIEKLVG